MKSLWNRDPVSTCGLVVVFPDDGATMWDPNVNSLVGDIEDKVASSFVTFALLNGQQPSLMDAVLAARFTGCTSMVVAVVDGDGGAIELIPSSGGDEISVTIKGCPRDSEAVARAYLDVLLGQPAACA